jgi:hypothetical protein
LAQKAPTCIFAVPNTEHDFHGVVEVGWLKKTLQFVQFALIRVIRVYDLVAQLVEHNTFNVGALGSSPSGITTTRI